MKVSLTTVAYCLPESIRALVGSLNDAYTDRRNGALWLDLFLASPFPDVADSCDAIARTFPQIRYHRYAENVGLARCWNDGILAGFENGADLVLVVNDDIRFGPGSINQWVNGAVRHFEENPAAIICTVKGDHGVHGKDVPLGYSAFAYSKRALETVGLFDENFLFTYCEDCDFARRAELLGLDASSGVPANIWHGGSQSIRGAEGDDAADTARIARIRHRSGITHGANQAYYRQKWGTAPGAPITEGMTAPFGDPRISLRIDPSNRANPYAAWGWSREYDRAEMVRLEERMVNRYERESGASAVAAATAVGAR